MIFSNFHAIAGDVDENLTEFLTSWRGFYFVFYLILILFWILYCGIRNRRIEIVNCDNFQSLFPIFAFLKNILKIEKCIYCKF